MANREVKAWVILMIAYSSLMVQLSDLRILKLNKDVNIWYNPSFASSGKILLSVTELIIQDGSVIHIATNGGTYIELM